MASCGVWLRSPHLLLQFYAPLAVVWAGCTHATAGAPDVLPMLLFVGATERLQQFCVTRTPARMRHAASVVVFVRVDCCLSQSSSSQCRVLRESSGRSRALAGLRRAAPSEKFPFPPVSFPQPLVRPSPPTPRGCAPCTREWLRGEPGTRCGFRSPSSARGVT